MCRSLREEFWVYLEEDGKRLFPKSRLTSFTDCGKKNLRRGIDCNNAPHEISERDFRLEGDVCFWFRKGFLSFNKKLHLQRICVSNVVRHFEQHPQPVSGRKQTLLLNATLTGAVAPKDHAAAVSLLPAEMIYWTNSKFLSVNNLHTKTC